MAKIKFDVSESDPKDAFKGAGEQPKPGVYKGKVVQLQVGAKKDDPSAKRLEVIVELTDKKYKGHRLYDYLPYSEAAQWKMDQFLQVFGVSTTKKRKGTFDTDDIVGETVTVRVSGETYDGNYRARLAAYLMPSDDDDDADTDDDDDDDDDDIDTDADDDDDVADDDDDDSEGDGPDFDALGEAADEDDDDAIAELKELAEGQELDPDDFETWADLATELKERAENEDSDDSDDDDDASDDDDPPPYEEWSIDDLKAEAKARKIKVKPGSKKSTYVKLLEANDDEDGDADDDDDDDEEPF